MCLHTERECCVIALGDQLSVDNRDCERMRVQIAHTSVALNEATASADSASSTTPLTRTTQLRRGKSRTIATNAAEIKLFDLWRLEKCDVRIMSSEARAIQLEVLGSARECLPKLVARSKHVRIDDDLKTSATKRSGTTASSRSAPQALEYLR